MNPIDNVTIFFLIMASFGLLSLQFVVFALIERKERKTQAIKDKINKIGENAE
jgi:hypothetical protein